MLDIGIFEKIRNEVKQIYTCKQNEKIASHTPSDYLFYNRKQPYEIESIIKLLKSENISLNTENYNKLCQAIDLLIDVSKELNEKKELSNLNHLQNEEAERLFFIGKVKDLLKENGVLFSCENLQCIYVRGTILIEPSEFFNFLSKNEMFYSVRGAHVKIYKNKNENIKQKIIDFLKKDFENKSHENLIPLLDSGLLFKAKIQWEDILYYCESMNKATFIN